MTIDDNPVYRIRLSNRVSKYLNKLDRVTHQRILSQLEILKSNPRDAQGSKALSGELAGYYRLRIGGYRAVYEVRDDDTIVIVLMIGPRGDVYKK